MIAHPQSLSPQAYLAWEEEQSLKYEYINGQVVAMTGGTLAHNSIALNLAAALKNHLRGKNCKVFMADAKVGITATNSFLYPDVVVTCDRRDQTARKIINYPCLIVEVLSPGTEALDRGQKFRNYRQIETLQEYVLIDAEQINIERYCLNENGKWELTTYPVGQFELASDRQKDLLPNQKIEFSSVSFNCAIALLYEDVVFADESL
ncbi:protein of unknown function DUF820 [Thalassoporum mexicanum PCC 7367]|uniref:Uma2 family endonuclease n=1 Tax=Thalassoporum mexicanum TaxID=3457544 RepID=UPI00029FB07B|nr:Uma2 family endonuclease [Pseudanabaena sp. PCC 7367]AFY71034.1 protein of unknown function DUF820 [Pseudanabaena sp. PCC 7367]